MSQKVDQIEAEAEAQADLAEEYAGDVLSSQFQQLERNHSADDDLLALKRRMGMAAPEEAREASPPPVQARVEAPTAPSSHDQRDQEELAAALEELEANQQEPEKRKAGR